MPSATGLSGLRASRQGAHDRDASAREHQRVAWGQVIRLAVLQEDDEKDRDVGPAEKAEATSFSREEEPQPGKQQEPVDRVQLQKLAACELHRRQARVLQRVRIADEFHGRPSVRHLPDNVRRRNGHGNGGADPEIAAAQPPPRRRQQDACAQPDDEESHAGLVLETESYEEAGQDPELLPSLDEDSGDDECRRGPEQDVPRIHRKDVEEIQHGGSDRDGDRGEDHRPPVATKKQCEPTGQHEGCATGERRQQPDGEQRFAEQRPRQPGDQRDKRRMVHVAPGEVFAAGKVVQLVAEDPVAVDHRQLQRDVCRGNYPDGAHRCLHNEGFHHRGHRGPQRFFCVRTASLDSSHLDRIGRGL